MKKIPIFDMHCDLLTHFCLVKSKKEDNVFKKYHKQRFIDGNIKYTMLNLWIDQDNVKPLDHFIKILMHSFQELLSNDDIRIVYNTEDLNSDDGRIKGILALEGLDYLNDEKQIYILYQLGIRLISFTWNNNNKLGYSHKSTGKLTNMGHKMIKLCNELGIVIDISHLNDECSLEILEKSTKPVIASHSNVRTICNVSRNVSDELIKGIVKTNGVIGMNASTDFIRAESNQDINLIIDHIDYLYNLVGIDYIALGFDFMDFLVGTNVNIADDEFLDGLTHQGEVQNLIQALFNSGYTVKEIEKIAYKNALRIFNDTLK